MEFTPLQIAKLVLGYLKSEKCTKAYDSFLDSSRHLSQNADEIRSRRYYVTRVNGFSLEDYLNEYGKIYTSIQERLEVTEYFVEHQLKSLSEQLLYLLDYARQSRASTPSRSRSVTPHRERRKGSERFTNDLSVIQEVVEPNATSLDDLPGNHDTDLENDVPMSDLTASVCKSQGMDSASGDDDEDLSVKVLTQLLDYHELHEKLAENINLVRNTSELSNASSIAKTSAIVEDELSSAIKAIVQRTEADPIFERFVDGIIESVNDTNDEQTDVLSNDVQVDVLDTSGRSEPNLSTPVKLSQSADTIKQRLRSSRKLHSGNQALDEENEAISTQSVQKALPPSLDDMTADVHKNLNVNANSGDIIFYDGSLENYMQTSTTVTTANPLLFGNGLLMLQPSLAQQTPSVVNTLDASKPYYLLNGSQIVSVPQYNVNNITEQDILTMPTVIVCDDKQQSVPPQNIVSQRYVKQPVQKKLAIIAPKNCTDIAENLSEFITLYPNSDTVDKSTPAVLSKQVPKSRRPKPKIKKRSPPKIEIRILKPDDEASNQPEFIKEEVVDVTQNEKEPEKDKIDSTTQVVQISNNTTPDAKKQCTRHSLSTPKSSSMSHVRALDFNFGTPGNNSVVSRKANTSPKTCKKTPTKMPSAKISKSLFCSPLKNVTSSTENVALNKNVENSNEKSVVSVVSNSNVPVKTKSAPKGDWDANLRAVMGPVSDRCPTPKRKRKDSAKAKKTVKKIVNMNETEVDAQAIEAALTSISPEKVEAKDTANSKIAIKRRRRIRSQNVISPNKIVRLKKRHMKEKIEEKPVLVPDVNDQDLVESSVEVGKENEIEETEEAAFRLINCNAKARFKKKCNIDNNVKKEVKVTKVKEIKSLEFVSDGTNKLILSPSKLNANKRNIVDVDEERIEKPKEKGTEEVEKTTQVDLEINSSKFITPEMPKLPAAQQPITAARNLTPLLETPVKMDVLSIPKTPGNFSPANNLDTPFTKVFKEQLHGVDISAIETPKFPLTPNFPFTPGSSYPHRSTDYSTSSSYYQPSDSEQNKSLEQLIIDECKRLETKQPTPVKINRDDENSQLKKSDSSKDVTEEEQQDLVHKIIAEQMKSLSQNIIGRKNLNLMKSTSNDEASSCENSSNWDSSSSSSDDDDSDDWVEGSIETVVEITPNTDVEPRYSLRPRKDSSEKKAKDVVESTKVIRKIITQTEVKTSLVDKVETMSFQEKVLKQLEEKRKRIIGKLKNESIPKKKIVVEKRNSKSPPKRKASVPKTPVVKSKPVPNRNRRKSSTPKKIDSIGENKDVAKMTVTKEVDNEIVLHLSSDGEQLQPFDVVETELLEGSTSSTPHPTNSKKDVWPPASFHNVLDSLVAERKQSNSDVEAETLVKGLKEWGIHLVPNKSPKKLTSHNTEKPQPLDCAPLKTNEVNPPEMFDEKICNDVQKPGIVSDFIKSMGKSEEENDVESVLEDGEILSDDECVVTIVETSQINTKMVLNEAKGTVEQDLNLSDSTSEVTFDIVTFTSHIPVIHDYRKEITKTIDDYDFSLLSKSVSAQVYIEALDTEVEKKMRVTPHECVLDIPEKPIKNDKIKILDCVTIPSPKITPLNALYYELFDKPIENASPLNDLYKPQETNRYGVKKLDPKARIRDVDAKVKSRRVSDDQKSENKKVSSQRYNRSKSLDQRNDATNASLNHVLKELKKPTKLKNRREDASHKSTKAVSKDVDAKKIKIDRKKDETKNTLKVVESSKCDKSKVVKDVKLTEREASLEDACVEKIVRIQTLRNDGLDVADAIINRDSKGDDSPDLMDYAICGSDRAENSDTENVKIGLGKRKAKDDEDVDSLKRPKTNCQELLRKIDVDSFLTKLHGDK